jgi:hypothetical protein
MIPTFFYRSSRQILTISGILAMAQSVLFPAPIAAQQLEKPESLPFIYDTQTNKYFIGGSTKFLLRPGQFANVLDKIEVSVDGGEYATYSDSGINFSGEGKHTLKFRASNSVNNWSPVQYVEVFLDQTPPSTETELPKDNFKSQVQTFVPLRAPVKLLANDNLSGIGSTEYSWDGQNFLPYTRPIVLEKTGRQTLYYRSSDRVGNVEPVHMAELFVDGTPPESSIKLNGTKKLMSINGKTYINDSVSFIVESKDDLSSVAQVWVTLDGKEQPYTKPIYFLKEGAHTVSYYAVDNVGNKEALKNLDVFVVTTPPMTTATPSGTFGNTGGINYARKDFELKLSAKESVAGLDRIEYRVDQEPEFHAYLEPIRLQTSGLHTIQYRSVDRAENMEVTKTYTVTIHETAPETVISSAQPTITKNGAVYSPTPNVLTFSVSNSPVGVAKTLFSIDDGHFQEYHGPITLTEGQRVYTIRYKSIDKLGNEEVTKEVSYHMMSAMPLIDLFVTKEKAREQQVQTKMLDQSTPTNPVAAPGSAAASKSNIRRQPASKK